MNRRDKDVLLALAANKYIGQRELGRLCGCSLGAINASVRSLLCEQYIDENMLLTEKSRRLLKECSPKRAVLLAAGVGMRRPHSSSQSPKPLVTVRSERIIDRLISQLIEAGVTEIYAVVGFAKEQFEYLIDKYSVKLIVNPLYAKKNNLHSLSLASDHLENCYIVPCDLWCKTNPFRKNELYSWYAVKDERSIESSVRINRKQDLAVVSPEDEGNVMVGISYLLKNDAAAVSKKLALMDLDRRYNGYFWEETLYNGDKLIIGPRVINDAVEIDSFDTLRELNLRSVDTALEAITRVLLVGENEIKELVPIKKGLNNTTFTFVYNDKKYCIRIPGALYDRLIVHSKEHDVYKALEGSSFTNDIVYFDRESGIKISEYIDGVRECDPQNKNDVLRCMKRLRELHSAKLTVPHYFDLFESIDFYESRWNVKASLYADYQITKQNVLSLKEYIDSQPKTLCLTHIDAVAENFLIPQEDGKEIRLIDWEYAAMQDPHLDIAMFCIMAMYSKDEIDAVIDAYFCEGCDDAVRTKIYCYIAIAGLLWSNWCEYEIQHGTEFGEYSLKQYRYAKEYYKIAKERI